MLRIGAVDDRARPLTVGPITVYPRAASASISDCSPAVVKQSSAGTGVGVGCAPTERVPADSVCHDALLPCVSSVRSAES